MSSPRTTCRRRRCGTGSNRSSPTTAPRSSRPRSTTTLSFANWRAARARSLPSCRRSVPARVPGRLRRRLHHVQHAAHAADERALAAPNNRRWRVRRCISRCSVKVSSSESSRRPSEPWPPYPPRTTLGGLTVLSGQSASFASIRFDPEVVVLAALCGTSICARSRRSRRAGRGRVAPVEAWRDAHPAPPAADPKLLGILPTIVGTVGVLALVVGIARERQCTRRRRGGRGDGHDRRPGSRCRCAHRACSLPGRRWRVAPVRPDRWPARAWRGTLGRVIAPILALVLGLGMVTTVAIGRGVGARGRWISSGDTSPTTPTSSS